MRRRSVLASAVTGALAGAFTINRATTAQEATPAALANHPLVGTWAVITPGGVVPQTHHADGSIIAAFPPNFVDPDLGLTFQGSALGQWESTGERSGRFTFIQAFSDGAGAYVGTFQLTAELEASEDGQSWSGTKAGTNEARIIVRDASNAITVDEVISPVFETTATRIGATIESVVLPEVTPMTGTPTP